MKSTLKKANFERLARKLFSCLLTSKWIRISRKGDCAVSWFEARCSIQLSYGRIASSYH